MPQTTYREYWSAISKDARMRASKTLGFTWRILGVVVSAVAGAITSYFQGGNMVSNIIAGAIGVGFWLVILFLVFIWHLVREPVIKFNEQGLALEGSLKEKDAEIEKLRSRLSIKEYEDINIEYYEYPWTDHQLNIGAGDFTNFLKIGLQVRNTGGIKVFCGLRMMSVQYKGYASNNDWVPNPNSVEKKLLKWDDGYDVPNGKIEIYPNGGIGRILLAESNPYNMEYWFWFVDGRSQNHQVLEGEYKALVHLEGDSEKDGVKTALEPVKFEIRFTYKGRKLFDVSVLKLSINSAQ